MDEYEELRKDWNDHYDKNIEFHNFMGTLPLKIGACMIGGILLIGGIGELIEHSKSKKSNLEQETQNEILSDTTKIGAIDYQNTVNYFNYLKNQ